MAPSQDAVPAKYPPERAYPSQLDPDLEPDRAGPKEPLLDRAAHPVGPPKRQHFHANKAWRQMWLAIGLAVVGLVGVDLWRAPGQRQATALGHTQSGKGWAYNSAEKTVVLFVHHDSDDANANTRFFIKHALHDRADFVFVLNGESDLRDEFPEHLPNVRVIQRENTCYDLGAHGEVLKANDKELVKKYDKFILMNASLRGPIMTRWSRDCWSNVFTDLVTDKVKLVGMTMNCLHGDEGSWVGLDMHGEGMDTTHKVRHIQAMLLTTDKVGIELLLTPLGLDACHSDYMPAVQTEIRLTSLIWHAGYKVEALMSMWNEVDNFEEECMLTDPMAEYVGGYLPLAEAVFAKTKKLPPGIVDKYAFWARNYSSYDHCPVD